MYILELLEVRFIYLFKDKVHMKLFGAQINESKVRTIIFHSAGGALIIGI